jgi:class 3 adenylate cyclase
VQHFFHSFAGIGMRLFNCTSILWRFWLLLLPGLLTAMYVNAQAIVIPNNPTADSVNLSASTWLLEDQVGTLTLEQVRSDTNAGRFRLGSSRIGFSASAYWVRFTIESRSPHTSTWWLDSGDRTLQEVDIFVPDEAGYYRRQSASSIRPFADRPLPTPDFVFPIELHPHRSTEIYMRIRSTGFAPVFVTLWAWNPDAYQLKVGREKTQWLIYVGMAAALALFNLLLYFSIRDRSYLFYVMSLLSIVWAASSATGGYGAAYEFFWPNSPTFERTAWILSITPALYFVSLFIFEFTQMPSSMPRLSATIRICVLLTVFFHVGPVLATAFHLEVPAWVLQTLAKASNLSLVPFLLFLTYGVLRLVKSGNRQAKFVLIAWLPLMITTILNSIAFADGQSKFPPALMWASAFELIVISLALADRFNQEKSARAEAQVALVEGLLASERELEKKVVERTQALQFEQARTKDLLNNILPVELAEELVATGTARPARHEAVTILFTDFRGFTQAVSTMPADRMVSELNEIFAAFDDITDGCGVEKIKTIGDAYMAAAGLPKPCADHAQRCVRAGLRMVAYLKDRNQNAAFKWDIRIGVHSGPVVAGVVGKRKYAFDIWGDTVNVASRMESSGEIGRVNVSAYTYDLIRSEFDCEYRGKVDAKGKGQIDMYFVANSH